jgi:hypothetical protein
VYKNRSVQERGDPRIIPPQRNWPVVGVRHSLLQAGLLCIRIGQDKRGETLGLYHHKETSQNSGTPASS